MNNLNPHSRLASFYRYFYLTETLPNNLCDYFWGLIIGFVCFPFVWPVMLINLREKRLRLYVDRNRNNYYIINGKPIPTYIGIFLNVLLLLFGVIFLGLTLKISGINIDTLFFGLRYWAAVMYLYVVGVIGSFTTAGLFMLIINILKLISKFLPKKKIESDEEYWNRQVKRTKKERERQEYKRQNPNFLILVWRWLVAFKEENCPLITWNYEDKQDNK